MISTLIFSPYLGAWVDLTPRLRAATILTLVQVSITWQHLGNILATSWQQSCEDLFPQGSANALSSVTLGFGLYHLAFFSSTSNLLILLTVAMGTAVIGGLATEGLSLLIQVLVKFVTPFSERLSRCLSSPLIS